MLTGYRLEAGGEGRPRVGGLPDLTGGEAWPHGVRRIPYTFVAQIDCADAARPLPEDFAGPPWERDGALVRISPRRRSCPDPAARRSRSTCPPGTAVVASVPDRRPTPGTSCGDSATPVRTVPCLTSKTSWSRLRRPLARGDGSPCRVRPPAAAGGAEPTRRTWGNGDLQLLGHVETMQGADPRHAGSPRHRDVGDLDAWRILINIDDGYPDLSFGDGGALAIVAPVADLAAGRYDRLVTEATMG